MHTSVIAITLILAAIGCVLTWYGARGWRDNDGGVRKGDMQDLRPDVRRQWRERLRQTRHGPDLGRRSTATAKEINIDVTEVATKDQLHNLLAQRLGFPDYYGHTWDAFDECIRDIDGPLVVRVKGFGALRSRLPRDAELWVASAEDLEPGRVRYYFDVF